MTAGDIIAEPMLVNGVPAATRQARVLELLDLEIDYGQGYLFGKPAASGPLGGGGG